MHAGAGGTQRLPRIVGRTAAKELIFTGRRINGTDALRLGLVDHLAAEGESAESRALQLARDIAQVLAIVQASKFAQQRCRRKHAHAMTIAGSTHCAEDGKGSHRLWARRRFCVRLADGTSLLCTGAVKTQPLLLVQRGAALPFPAIDLSDTGLLLKVIPTEDRMEGLRAFAEKRQPEFKGR